MSKNGSRNRDRDAAWGLDAWIAGGALLFLMGLAGIILGGIALQRILTLPACQLCANVTSDNCTILCNGTAAATGAAQFIYTTQSPNDSVPPGTAFTISTVVFNSVGSGVVASAAQGGTVFTLAAGLYQIQYEASLGSAGSIVLYTGATSGSLAVDTDTIAGSSTATTWIHGTALIDVSTTLVVALSSHTGTAAIVTAGNAAGFYMVRMSFVKLA